MIEIPRAALTADKISETAEFFSFGTNDLTQMTFGISRDDAERKFLVEYVKRRILEKNPFQSLDVDGVGQMITLAVAKGRRTRPDLEIGVCGEHGGDPDSIAFFNRAGLNYVSCSPYRIPVARLAAGRSVILAAADPEKGSLDAVASNRHQRCNGQEVCNDAAQSTLTSP
jgi:pyruvate,orthophosphate dikinase